MIFFKNLKLFPFLYFVKINLEKVFANVQDRYKSFPGYKKDRLFKKKLIIIRYFYFHLSLTLAPSTIIVILTV